MNQQEIRQRNQGQVQLGRAVRNTTPTDSKQRVSRDHNEDVRQRHDEEVLVVADGLGRVVDYVKWHIEQC